MDIIDTFFTLAINYLPFIIPFLFIGSMVAGNTWVYKKRKLETMPI